MKKLLLSSIALCICLGVSAQNAKTKANLLPIVGAAANKAVPVKKATAFDATIIAIPNPNVSAHFGNPMSQAETSIGGTSYDLQSNYGATGNRVKLWSDGTISAVWTLSAGAAGYPDRGTGYNYNNGSGWMPSPSARIESVRTGFPNVTGSDNTGAEAVICHHPNAYSVLRPAKGTGSWTEADLPYPSAVASTWPRAVCGGANGTTLHVIANTGGPGNGQLEELNYWRSQDFGVSWDMTEVKISVLDSLNIIDPTADGYDIDSRGDVVAIVCGGFANDLVLAKSTDNGSTWTKRVIMEFPIALYDGVSMTDIDGDGVADTCETSDSGPSVVIDNNGQCHVWVGGMRVLNDGTGTGTVYFPGTDGLYYWNESYPDGDLFNHLVDFIHDLDGDLTITFQTGDPALYQCSLTGMPGGAVCDNGKLMVVYTSLVENTSSGTATPQTYRDVFYSESTDGGATWSVGQNITQTDFDEEAFTNMAKRPNGNLHMIYHRDSEPGTSLGGDADPVGPSDVLYRDEPFGCPVSVEENTGAINFAILAPNPASDFTKLNFSLAKAGLVQVEVVNLLGAVVSKIENDLTAGNHSLTLDISKLQNGVYNVKTTIGTDVFTNTLVKK